MIDPPEPNGPPIQVEGFTVEQRICKCCKDPKPHFFVKEGEKVVMMALSWDSLCKQKGW